EPDDPRVEELATQRYHHHKALGQAIAAAGLDTAEEKLFESYGGLDEEHHTRMSAFDAITKMPYDFSPARLRCIERTGQLLGQDP
ncbi:MerR family transcriptional regulator, partial [Crossiella sp. NPDC003009]